MVDSLKTRRSPATWLALICLVIAILLSPPLVGELISLDWKICDMRPVAVTGQVLMASMALLLFAGRRRMNAWLSEHAPSGKTLGFVLVTVSLSTVLSLAVMEVGLRFFRDPLRITWEPADHQRVKYDPLLGWTYIQNQSVMQPFVSGQSAVPVHTDERGTRVPTPGTRLDPNLPTVIFVGGSYTMGYGLPFEDTFVGRLAGYPNFPYQVVNLGVEAYGTDQAWLRLRQYIDTFDTVAVIYTFLPAHVNRNHNYDRRILFPGVRMAGTKPLFGLRRDGSVYLKKEPVKIEDHSSLRLWVYMQRAWLKWGPEPGLEVSRGLINAMGKDVESAGATFILVYWDFWGDQETYFYSVLEGISFPLVDLCAQPPDGWQDMRLPGDSHPNAEASAFVAARLAAQLAELDLMSVQ
jgi:hypothetical protein